MAYLVADNETRRGAEPSDTELAALLDELQQQDFDLDSLGFDEAEYSAMLEGLTPELPEPGNGGDEFEPDEAAPCRVQAGDVWLIGGMHRLICGDSTDPATVDRLMQGERADMVFTDPPYGIAYDGSNRPDQHSRQYESILENDGCGTLHEFADSACAAIDYVLRDGGVVYVFTAIVVYPEWRIPFERRFRLRAIPVWVKDNPAAGRSDFFWGYEPMLYGTKGAQQHIWNGGRGQTDVWQFRNVNSFGYIKDDGSRNAANDAQIHPTQKPLDLVVHAITLSSNTRDLVVDPFLGSGTTIIAAHRTGRRCYGCEISEAYCEVILQRCEAEGLTVEKVSTAAVDEGANSL
jgi:DNA modification methylase